MYIHASGTLSITLIDKHVDQPHLYLRLFVFILQFLPSPIHTMTR